MNNEEIKKLLEEMDYSGCCCNSYWPMEFAHALIAKVKEEDAAICRAYGNGLSLAANDCYLAIHTSIKEIGK